MFCKVWRIGYSVQFAKLSEGFNTLGIAKVFLVVDFFRGSREDSLGLEERTRQLGLPND